MSGPEVTGAAADVVDDADVADVAVIGGGIVGLATALTLLQRRPGSSVVVLEKENEVGVHQTGHNSGVIHAGIYYEPGSLKARLCKAGATWTRRFCDEHGIEYRNTGKLIVATDDAELVRLDALYERALVNGLDVERVDAAELRRREPHVVGRGAVFLRSTGIVDYRAVCRAMATQIEASGGRVLLGTQVVGIHESLSEVGLDVVEASTTAAAPRGRTAGSSRGAGFGAAAGRRTRPQTQRRYARHLVVCGGLQADRLAALAGLRPDFAIVPFRGEYYRLPEHRRDLVSTLIYPVPDPALPFLGVHLTLTMDGGLTVGPNAVLGMAREGYRKGSVNLPDLADILRYPGFWPLARTHLRTGVAEQWNSLSKRGYLGLVRRYCPELTVADLLPEPAGIRAQAVRRDGTLVHDFLLESTGRMLHVCNAPSPAATSAMPIADLIVRRLLGEPPP